ncbi:MAG: UxaA family hydrolase [Opitutaceae bacterium]|nr:UxaA family hydrolase [Opitutaceae bacterium]
MSSVLPLAAAGRLPAPDDNVAIAVRRLDAGTRIEIAGEPRTLRHTVLEGHRFAVAPIAPGGALRSWGLPFGYARAPVAPGDYVCNASILAELAVRRLGIALPTEPNFTDHTAPFVLDEASFRPGPEIVRAAVPQTFDGYRRPAGRGVGTRNTVVILGTTSRTASFARQLAARLQPLARAHPALDGIVAVAHTEGGGPGEPNNAAEVLRALAGFMVHPNVGAVLAVDYGTEPVSNARLRAYLAERGYPLAGVPHAFLSLRSGLAAGLAEGEAIVRRWLPAVAAERRTPEPVSELRVALQCGGSDAFSGVSGNPLAGAIVHEVVRQGGIGVLCETDELSGAEAYLVRNVRDRATVRALLGRIEGFSRRLAWHGVTPEANPSGGNRLRGLYNITLKSLGAVHKKDPRTRIDHVIDYADPLRAPGFYFMDSPGNDLEGIAGQVGSGCNLFLFVTGNGSVTNFPFVPTLKLTTTTRRHQLLSREMDINAGRYLDGEPMERLAAESFALLLATASGRRTRGELAGHSQTSLWRDWRQTDGSRLAEIRARPQPDGRPLRAGGGGPAPAPAATLALYPAGGRFATERVGLVLPTSMCAAQIARLAAERLNAAGAARPAGLDRFVALAHSEGCGFGGESLYQLLVRSYHGYATHPNVAAALLLEHGCEKIPNDAMRRQFEAAGLPLERFGWASVQLDGGIDRSLDRVAAWFAGAGLRPVPRVPATPGALAVGLLSDGPAGPSDAGALAAVAAAVLAAGGSVLLPEGDALLADPGFRRAVLGGAPARATLAYGQAFVQPGLHLVATETAHWVENLTGLGACGAHLLVGLVGDTPQQGHPLLPVLQAAAAGARAAPADVDCALTGADADAATLLRLVWRTAQGEHVPAASAAGFVDFQLARGLLGVST